MSNTFLPVPCSLLDDAWWNGDDKNGYFDIRRAALDFIHLRSHGGEYSIDEMLRRWKWYERTTGRPPRKLVNIAKSIIDNSPFIPLMDSNGIYNTSKSLLYMRDLDTINKMTEDKILKEELLRFSSIYPGISELKKRLESKGYKLTIKGVKK